jgi:Protein of unknown function (DUF3500)
LRINFWKPFIHIILTIYNYMKTQFSTLISIGLVGIFTIAACNKTSDSAVTPTTASITTLTCSSATFSGTATVGAAYIGTATVPYTGGNAAIYAAGTDIASTGVTGLKATLSASTLSTGAGNLIYAISGTPAAVGTATFAISFGGQSCNIALTVSAAPTTVGTGLGITTDVAKIVGLAEAFKATLSATQLSTLQLAYTKTDATKWSNLPQALSKNRVGLPTSSLSATQLVAFKKLLEAATGTVVDEGNAEMLAILAADDYLGANGGGSDYGSGNYYIAFLGMPSATGQWEFQFGGHHGTISNTYNGGKLSGATPAFRSTEPFPTYTQGGVAYKPIVQEITTLSAMLTGLSAAEQTTAKTSTSQSDLVLGPGKDGVFPTTKKGLKVGTLTQAKKDAVLAAIKTYTDDLDDVSAAAILAKYTKELDETYISYAGTTALTEKGDYVLIDGPNVWIEFSMQGGIVIRNANHPHSVWRDRTGDYGGN